MRRWSADDLRRRHPRRVRAPAPSPVVPDGAGDLGLVVEHRASGFCGDVVGATAEAVTLRDRHDRHRHFRWQAGAFAIDGRAVTLVRAPREPPAARRPRQGRSPARARIRRLQRMRPSRVPAASGSRDATTPSSWSTCGATTSASWRSWWSRCTAPTTSSAAVAAFRAGARPSPGRAARPRRRRLEGIAAGGNRARPVRARRPGTRSSTCGPPSARSCSVSTNGPTCRGGHRGRPGCAPHSACRSTGSGPGLRRRIRSYADLRPELVGAVERLIDFVSAD